MSEPQGRVDTFQFLFPKIQRVNDRLERVAVVNDLASYLGVAPGLVLDHFRKAAADRVERTPAPKMQTSGAIDHILLPLLVSDDEARAELIDQLRDLPALRQLATAPIFDAIFAMHEAEETINFNSLQSRIPESLQDTLAALVLDGRVEGVATLENGLACVERLRRNDRETRLRDLNSRIQSAEREGRVNDALAMIQQRDQLKRESFGRHAI